MPAALDLSGWLYEDGRFQSGSVTVEDGVVVEVRHRPATSPIARGLILPAFTNAHTHAGDAVVHEELTGTLEELVAPPNGLKHRVLASARDEDVVAAMRAYFESMLRGGTTSFWDFREMGMRGAKQLYAAALGLPLRPVVLARPPTMTYEAREASALLRLCDGIGLSSLLDWERDEAAKLARDARAAGKAFATHASERVREDIDGVLDLKPNLLIHMTEATDADLARVADAGVPVAVCPSSNAFFGKIVDLPRMSDAGVRLLLGTDNAMINAPSMLRELNFAWKVSRLRGGMEPRVLLDMALRGRKGLSGMGDVSVAPGDPADLVVLGLPEGRPTFGGVFRAADPDVVLVSAGERTWVRSHAGLVELPASERAGGKPPSRRRPPARPRGGRRRSRSREPR